jgi:hypothetical protein
MYAVPGELGPAAAAALASPFLDDEDRDVAETARWVTDTSRAPQRT